MAISASMVKELREKSGAGMMDCKKALVETDGDMDAALQFLKEKGLSKAAKKAGRVAAEGLVLTKITDGKSLMLELNCETDFAAKSEGFLKLSDEMLDYFMANGKEEGEPVDMTGGFYDSKVEEITTQAIATIGENIKPRRFVVFNGKENSYTHSYIHMGGKIGVLVEVEATDASVFGNSEIAEMADGVAMQIASMKPECVDADAFPKEKIDAEREVFTKQVLESGKPANIVDKIVEGKVRKFVSENTLTEQVFVMNSDLKVKDLVKETSKKVGADLKIVRFARFELGEGIEKKQENFADEVAAQMKA